MLLGNSAPRVVGTPPVLADPWGPVLGLLGPPRSGRIFLLGAAGEQEDNEFGVSLPTRARSSPPSCRPTSSVEINSSRGTFSPTGGSSGQARHRPGRRRRAAAPLLLHFYPLSLDECHLDFEGSCLRRAIEIVERQSARFSGLNIEHVGVQLVRGRLLAVDLHVEPAGAHR